MGKKINAKTMRKMNKPGKTGKNASEKKVVNPPDATVKPFLYRTTAKERGKIYSKAMALVNESIKNKNKDKGGNCQLYEMISEIELMVIKACGYLHETKRKPINAFFKHGNESKSYARNGLNKFGKYFVKLEQRFRGLYNTISQLVRAVNATSTSGITYCMVPGSRFKKKKDKIRLLKARRTNIKSDVEEVAVRRNKKYVVQLAWSDISKNLQSIHASNFRQAYLGIPQVTFACDTNCRPESEQNCSDIALTLTNNVRKTPELFENRRKVQNDLQAFDRYEFTLNSDHLTDMQIRGLITLGILTTEEMEPEQSPPANIPNKKSQHKGNSQTPEEGTMKKIEDKRINANKEQTTANNAKVNAAKVINQKDNKKVIKETKNEKSDLKLIQDAILRIERNQNSNQIPPMVTKKTPKVNANKAKKKNMKVTEFNDKDCKKMINKGAPIVIKCDRDGLETLEIADEFAKANSGKVTDIRAFAKHMKETKSKAMQGREKGNSKSLSKDRPDAFRAYMHPEQKVANEGHVSTASGSKDTSVAVDLNVFEPSSSSRVIGMEASQTKAGTSAKSSVQRKNLQGKTSKKNDIVEKEDLKDKKSNMSGEKSSFPKEKSNSAEIKNTSYVKLTSDKKPLTSDKKLLISDKKPLNSDKKPLTLDNKPLTSDKKPLNSDKKPLTSDKKPHSTDEKPLTSDKKPLTSDNKPLTSDKKPLNSDKKLLISDKKPLISDKKPLNSDNKTLTSDKKPHSTDEKPLTSDKKPLTSDNKPVTSDKKPLNSDKKPLTSDKKPLTSGIKPLTSDKKPFTSDNKLLNSDKKPLISDKKPHTSDKKSLNSDEKPLNSDKKPLTSDNKPLISDKKPLNSDKKPHTLDKNPLTSDKKPFNSDKKPLTSDKKPHTIDKKPHTSDGISGPVVERGVPIEPIAIEEPRNNGPSNAVGSVGNNLQTGPKPTKKKKKKKKKNKKNKNKNVAPATVTTVEGGGIGRDTALECDADPLEIQAKNSEEERISEDKNKVYVEERIIVDGDKKTEETCIDCDEKAMEPAMDVDMGDSKDSATSDDMDKESKNIKKESKNIKMINEDPKKIEKDTKKVENDAKKIENDAKKIESDAKKIEREAKKIENAVNKIEEESRKIDEISRKIEREARKIEKEYLKKNENKGDMREESKKYNKAPRNTITPLVAKRLTSGLQEEKHTEKQNVEKIHQTEEKANENGDEEITKENKKEQNVEGDDRVNKVWPFPATSRGSGRIESVSDNDDEDEQRIAYSMLSKLDKLIDTFEQLGKDFIVK